jgi:hypothetical protein
MSFLRLCGLTFSVYTCSYVLAARVSIAQSTRSVEQVKHSQRLQHNSFSNPTLQDTRCSQLSNFWVVNLCVLLGYGEVVVICLVAWHADFLMQE